VTTPFRNAPRLLDHGRRELRADALAIAAAALAAVDPAAALRGLIRVEGDALFIRGAPWVGLRPPGGAMTAGRPPDGAPPSRADARDEPGGDADATVETIVPLAGRRVFLVGAGKAGLGMAALLDELLGPRFTDAVVVVKRGQAAQLPRPLRHIEMLEASHPVPDGASLAGGLRLLAVAGQVREGDLVIGVVTGGSSALAVAPAAGLTLADKVATNRLLLACGADIVAINNVRKHLSLIKGGLLAAACGRRGTCQIVNFTVSDVVGDPLDYVTDLTVPDRSTWAAAHDTCDRFGLWEKLPAAVADRLRQADPAQETPKDVPGTTAGEAMTWVVADAARMCTAAAGEARRLGYAPRLLGLDWEGEARDAGGALARELLASPPGACLLAGGENTVTLAAGRHEPGGPSQEAALAAALDLTAPAVALCIDSDGTDGPTEAAGGLVDDLTARGRLPDGEAGAADGEARGAGGASQGTADLIRAALADHAAHDALLAVGDLILSGPTDTNVNDLKIGLRPH
jgi:glycerate 2-kinase